ncbi:MAG: lysostaphin resistance A-like protein [Candidatus Hermodarchaeota archaeon]
MLIQEKNGSFFRFFVPAALVFCSYLILRLISILVYVITIPFITIEEGSTTYLLLLSLFHILVILIILFVFIPYFKVKNDGYQPFNIQNTIKTFLLSCIGLYLGILSTLVLASLLIPVFGFPQNPTDFLLKRMDSLTPIYIIVGFILMAVLIPLWEELTFRRLLIPLLEEGGLSPLLAVLASSLMFAFGHVSFWITNGNLTTLLIQLPKVFLFGLILGFIYIDTRNVSYSVLAHGIANGLGFIPLALIYLNNETLNIIFELIYGLILLLGLIMSIIIGIYTWKNYNDQNFSILRIKTTNSIRDVFRLTLIFVGLIAIDIIASIGLKIFISDQILRNQISLFPGTILLAVLLWLVKSKADYTEVRRFEATLFDN